MKKVLWITFLFCAVVTLAHAGTDPKTADFLKQLNRYYYSLSREGVKSLKASGLGTMSKSGKGIETSDADRGKNLNYEFICLPETSKTLLNPVVSETDTVNRIHLKNICSELFAGPFLKLWSAFNAGTIFHTDTADYTVTNHGNDGFTVNDTTKGINLALNFNRQAVLQSARIPEKDGFKEMTFEWIHLEKGFLLKRIGMDIPSKEGPIHLDCVIDYTETQRFRLPQSMSIILKDQDKKTDFDLKLSDYKIHRSIGEGDAASPSEIQVVQSASEPAGQKHYFWCAKSGAVTVYLLGSVHIGTDSPLKIPEVVDRSYRSANFVGFEVDISKLSQIRQEMAAAPKTNNAEIYYPNNETLLDHLTPSQWEEVRKVLDREGISEKRAVHLKPGFLANTINMLSLTLEGYDFQRGIDNIFFRKAQTDKKPVFGMEFWQDSLVGRRSGITMTDQEQLDALMASVRGGAPREPDVISGGQRYWSNGDLEGMGKFFESISTPYSKALDKLVLDGRNKHWMLQFDRIFQTHGIYFIVVGAAHFIGPNGLPALLKARGYQVDQL